MELVMIYNVLKDNYKILDFSEEQENKQIQKDTIINLIIKIRIIQKE